MGSVHMKILGSFLSDRSSDYQNSPGVVFYVIIFLVPCKCHR
jgi:hypothetical protein